MAKLHQHSQDLELINGPEDKEEETTTDCWHMRSAAQRVKALEAIDALFSKLKQEAARQ